MPLRLPLRRSLVLAASAAALATSLSSCGFDYATDRVYTPAAGPLDRDGEVDVLSAVIVSASPGEGTFVAGLSNNSGTDAITFSSLEAAEGDTLTVDEFDAREIPALGYENLSLPGNGIGVTGNFEAGDFITVALGFSNGETSTLQIPVVTACDMWEGLDTAPDGAEAYDCTPLPPVTDFGGETHKEQSGSDEEQG